MRRLLGMVLDHVFDMLPFLILLALAVSAPERW